MALTRDHVIWSYRLFLDREPENEAVIETYLNAWHNTEELRMAIMSSAEFKTFRADLAYSTEKTIVIKEIAENVRLFVDISDYYIGLGIIRNRFELSETSFVRTTVKPGETVLDIGANIGYFSMHMASCVGPTGKVYAFEPLDRNVEMLNLSCKENGFTDRVVIENVALGATSGSTRIAFVPDSIYATNTFVVADDTTAPADHQIRNVKMLALDDYPFTDRVSFIKIDVEGVEPLVFRGAQNLLRRDRPVIISEIFPFLLQRQSGCTATEFIIEMDGYGYDCYLLKDGKLAEKITSIDENIRLCYGVFLPR